MDQKNVFVCEHLIARIKLRIFLFIFETGVIIFLTTNKKLESIHHITGGAAVRGSGDLVSNCKFFSGKMVELLFHRGYG